MRHTTVRITTETRSVLRSLAREEKRPMHAVLRSALEQYSRARFVNEVNAGYAALRKDSIAWQAELAERAEWESLTLDGIEEKPASYGRPRSRLGKTRKKR